MPGKEELRREAARELRDIDSQALFWVDIVVATAENASADDVDWTMLNWAEARRGVELWLGGVDPNTLSEDSPEAWLMWLVPNRDDVRLWFRARPRGEVALGHTRQPSLVIAEPEPIPDLQFGDGGSASLYELSIGQVRDLAIGHRRLAIELPSHRETWSLLIGTVSSVRTRVCPELLGESVIAGVHAVERDLGPDRHGALILDDDLGAAEEAISAFCQTWGGACHLLFPLERGRSAPMPPWTDLLRTADLDSLWSGELAVDAALRSEVDTVSGHGVGEPLLSLLAAQGRRRDDWPTIRVALPDCDDPWYIAYLGSLGVWPERPDTHLLRIGGLREDLMFTELFPTDRETVTAPDADDLLTRLREATSTYPAQLTVTLLATYAAPREADLPSEPVLPPRNEKARRHGPNIVVVYEPGSVRDLCLLWDLRAAHAIPKRFPLAVPANSHVVEALRHWQSEHAFTYWGLRETRGCLVSFSVPLERLSDIALAAGGLWETAEPGEVLQAAKRPARISSDVVTFSAGGAHVAAWTASDRDAVGWRRGYHDLHVNISLPRRPLPRSRTLEQRDWGSRFRAGGFEAQVGEPTRTIEMRWPSGWTVLTAMARDRGLTVRPSAAGRAAAALMNRLGSIYDLQPVLSDEVLAELYRLAERGGISWFRSQVRAMSGRMARASEGEQLARIEQHLRELPVTASDVDQRSVTFEELYRVCGGRETARLWLEWAEARGLLVRGTEIRCDQCGARSWRAVGELAPPIICRGCGEAINQPFPADQLTFRYRASEALLHVGAHDALPHLLTMRWLVQLLAGHMDRPSIVYGAYPGVEFIDSGGQLVGEADLVLALTTGDLVVAECKRGPAGLNDEELAKLERLAARVGSPWSVVATPAPASECGPIWRNAVRVLPDTPRFALTGEHLLERYPVWALGANPFAWSEATEAEWAKQRHDWQMGMPRSLEWLLERRDSDTDLLELAASRSETATLEPQTDDSLN